jgi:hypothetical protein
LAYGGVVRTCGLDLPLLVADVGEFLVVAGPAMVPEGVEGEREVGGTEADEVEVAEEEEDFGGDGAEAKATNIQYD